jgi:hypothetical protein
MRCSRAVLWPFFQACLVGILISLSSPPAPPRTQIHAAVAKKTRILDVVYNASNNELVRTKTLVKSAIVQVDATPYRQFYEQHYGQEVGKKKKGAAAKKDGAEGEVRLRVFFGG